MLFGFGVLAGAQVGDGVNHGVVALLIGRLGNDGVEVTVAKALNLNSVGVNGDAGDVGDACAS